MIKKFLICLILSIIIYILLFTMNSIVFAGNTISLEEAEALCPGITSLVNSLKASHSNYNFEFYNTGIDWNEAILREYQGHGYEPNNLFNVGTNYSGMWYCPVCGTTAYDNGSLCCASMDALRYMMDPRNSLTEDSVFQFKSLSIADTSYDDISRVVANTFLNDAECINAIIEASQAYNINAFYLVAKMLTEHGSSGSTLSSGVVRNGVTYYNFFNCNASGNSTEKIIENGTNYAVNNGWNTKRLSILGGAQLIRDSYIGKGQNTCYYQKWNVVNTSSGLFTHQYAQNILSAENEGRKFKSYYTVNGTVTGTHTFIIPLYTNMPTSTSERPSTTKTNSITYETAVVTANGGLKVRAGQDINSTQISTIAKDASVKVLIRASSPNASDGYYWDLVIDNTDGDCGYVARNYLSTTGSGSNSGDSSDTEYTDGEKMVISGGLFEISTTLTVEEIVASYPDSIIKNSAGEICTELCTGYTISINNTEYVIVKKGDVNGDGKANIIDAVAMLNHIKGTNTITDSYKLEAAKLSSEDRVSIVEVVKLLNYIKKNVTDILVN